MGCLIQLYPRRVLSVVVNYFRVDEVFDSLGEGIITPTRSLSDCKSRSFILLDGVLHGYYLDIIVLYVIIDNK